MTQPEALRLADEVDEVAQTYPDMAEVSAELRRLVALNQELLEALKGLLRWMPIYPAAADAIVGGRKTHSAAISAARAAIAKAEAQK